MSGGIYLLNGDQLLEMVEQRYDTEDVLQSLIATFPSLLAGDQFGANEPRRWVLVAREAGLPSEQDGGGRWSVDHLFLDQDAVPTLVEVKRSSDTRIRREVVGQVLDYAAHAVINWPEHRLRELFERRCESDLLDPESEISAVVDPEADVDAFWQQAWTNLRAGRIRLVLLSDEIPSELRRVVEFLNGQMDPAEVIAIEVKQYVGDGVKTLVPRAIGQTAAVEARKGQRESRRWDEESFFAEIAAKRPADEVRIARDLVAWSRAHMSRLTWGRGKVDGSCIPVLDVGASSVYPIAIYTYGRVEVQFHVAARAPVRRRGRAARAAPPHQRGTGSGPSGRRDHATTKHPVLGARSRSEGVRVPHRCGGVGARGGPRRPRPSLTVRIGVRRSPVLASRA